MNFGVWHNGNTNLPLKETEDGLVIPDASLAEMHEDRRRVAIERIEHGILADERGYDRLTFTEHHFVLTGAEFSPNPLQSQAVVAYNTEDIKLRQVANILSWHDPVRLAEQAAMLDVVSDGRAEVGIGRGYQPREGETFGQYWGGGVGDQEKNRAAFEEKVEILRKAWTEDVMTHHGQFHQVPPTWTRWHHPQERAYLADQVTEYGVEDYIDWAEGSVDETALSPSYPDVVSSGESTLEAVSVFPQPVQEPHPQLWEPVGSPRSIRFAAENGINPYLAGARDPAEIDRVVESYYDAVEAAGWPDHRPEYDGEPFGRPWDEERERGLTIYVPVFNTAVADEETYERWLQGIKGYWQYIGFFGFAGGLPAEEDEHPIELLRTLDPELFVERDLYLAGDAEYIADRLAHVAETLDAGEISFDLAFENMGITGEEADAQLEAFADRVVPYLEEEFPTGGDD
jgi:alkanesulfonate monooxygenase SsuD/methylene tetrahydromethanopterin reductase-like flavin-dependent oxidoreductase (luciferase family)